MDVCTQQFLTGADPDNTLITLHGPNVLHGKNLPCQFGNYILCHHLFIIVSIYRYMGMTLDTT